MAIPVGPDGSLEAEPARSRPGDSVTLRAEMDAIIAFLQSLGNHVKFEEGANYRD